MSRPSRSSGTAAGLSDDDIVDRVRLGDVTLYEVLMRRHNQRVFRATRAVLGRDDDAEDAAQSAWIQAWRHLADFGGRAKFSTWLLRIAVREAIAVARKRDRLLHLASDAIDASDHEPPDPNMPAPDQTASDAELSRAIQAAVDRLPPTLRTAFVLREVEGLDTSEASAALEISEPALKVRLHRARAYLRADLERRIGAELASVYAFAGERCDRIVARVLAELRKPPPTW